MNDLSALTVVLNFNPEDTLIFDGSDMSEYLETFSLRDLKIMAAMLSDALWQIDGEQSRRALRRRA